MMEMVQGSRFGVALMGLGIMRRSLPRGGRSTRTTAPPSARLIADYPLVRETLVDMAVEVEAGCALAFEAAEAGGRKDDESRRLYRILVPLAKFRCTRRGVELASQAVEMHGGNGYIENWPVARQLRDAQCHTIWEGTENIICLDVLRCDAEGARRRGALRPRRAGARRRRASRRSRRRHRRSAAPSTSAAKQSPTSSARRRTCACCTRAASPTTWPTSRRRRCSSKKRRGSSSTRAPPARPSIAALLRAPEARRQAPPRHHVRRPHRARPLRSHRRATSRSPHRRCRSNQVREYAANVMLSEAKHLRRSASMPVQRPKRRPPNREPLRLCVEPIAKRLHRRRA